MELKNHFIVQKINGIVNFVRYCAHTHTHTKMALSWCFYYDKRNNENI